MATAKKAAKLGSVEIVYWSIGRLLPVEDEVRHEAARVVGDRAVALAHAEPGRLALHEPAAEDRRLPALAVAPLVELLEDEPLLAVAPRGPPGELLAVAHEGHVVPLAAE